MAQEKNQKTESALLSKVWNIANVLTVLRLILVPVFMVALLTDGGDNTVWRLSAAGIFLSGL